MDIITDTAKLKPFHCSTSTPCLFCSQKLISQENHCLDEIRGKVLCELLQLNKSFKEGFQLSPICEKCWNTINSLASIYNHIRDLQIQLSSKMDILVRFLKEDYLEVESLSCPPSNSFSVSEFKKNIQKELETTSNLEKKTEDYCLTELFADWGTKETNLNNSVATAPVEALAFNPNGEFLESLSCPPSNSFSVSEFKKKIQEELDRSNLEPKTEVTEDNCLTELFAEYGAKETNLNNAVATAPVETLVFNPNGESCVKSEVFSENLSDHLDSFEYGEDFFSTEVKMEVEEYHEKTNGGGSANVTESNCTHEVDTGMKKCSIRLIRNRALDSMAEKMLHNSGPKIFSAEEVLRKSKTQNQKCNEKAEAYLCEECGKCYLSERGLSSHRMRFHNCPAPYSCFEEGCDQKFVNKTSRIKHERETGHNSRGPRNLQCEKCGMTFVRERELKLHEKYKHLEPEMFRCRQCSFYATSELKLKKHIKTHELEKKKNKCDFCDYTSPHMSRVKRHEKIHSRKKRQKEMFSCDLCDYRTDKSSSFRKHLQSITHLLMHQESIDKNSISIITSKGLKFKNRCPEENCDFSCACYKTLDLHLEKIHQRQLEVENLHFQNEHDFIRWKNNLQATESSRFCVKTKGCNSKSNRDVYECARSGSYQTQGKVRVKKSGSIKCGKTCPSRIVRTGHENGFNVTYWKTHIGHDVHPKYVGLTPEQKAEIAKSLAEGIPKADLIRNFRSNSDTNTRLAMLSYIDLHNIKMHWKSKNVDDANCNETQVSQVSEWDAT